MAEPRAASLRWMVPAVAVAAVVVVWLVQPTAPDRPAPGTRIVAGADQTVALGPHRLELAATSVVELEDTDPRHVRIRLDSGSLACNVQPLVRGASFAVATAHAQVTVVGTAFTVEAQATCTQVRVTEGVVEVAGPSGHATLTAGEAQAFCAADDEVEPSDEVETTKSQARFMREALDLIAVEDDEAAISKLEAYRRAYPEGHFVEDSLFHQVVLEAERGRDAEAELLFNQLSRRFPGSPRIKSLEALLSK